MFRRGDFFDFRIVLNVLLGCAVAVGGLFLWMDVQLHPGYSAWDKLFLPTEDVRVARDYGEKRIRAKQEREALLGLHELQVYRGSWLVCPKHERWEELSEGKRQMWHEYWREERYVPLHVASLCYHAPDR